MVYGTMVSQFECSKKVQVLEGYLIEKLAGRWRHDKSGFCVFHFSQDHQYEVYIRGLNPRPMDPKPGNTPLDKSDHCCPEAVTGLFRYRCKKVTLKPFSSTELRT
ncbi:hypothetical protein TNCV_3100911 [Trichonephila clavipes]|nr:hypothetical protein TNCV_3100911 [Trichonephila clavipes]